MAAKSYSSKEKQSPKSRPDNANSKFAGLRKSKDFHNRFRAVIDVGESADLVYKALSPEGTDVARERSSYKLTRKDATLSIEISASDIVAFKATLNSIIRQIELSLKL